MTTRPAIRKAVILVSSAVAILYLVYRGVFTLNLNTSYAIFASLFLYIGELYGVMNMLLYFVQVWDAYEPPQKPLLEGVRTVDIFVPTYNEDPDLLRMTLQACLRLDYPHKRIFICDDGKRPAVEALAKDLGVTYMIRPDNRHAKAGNLNHAFAKTDGEFIIIFDADHVPDPNFITRLIGYFEDEKMGFVQTPHGFYNFESFQARLNHAKGSYWEEGQLFYHVIQPGRNHWNAPIFAGSAAMFRRKALEEVGFIAVETITEDMHTGLRMHSKGWKSLGISVRMITGQAAQDVTTFHTQRLRWGEGNLSVLAYDNPLTLPGLSWGQRLCYFGTMINWCGGVFKLPIYLTPLLMLFTGVPPVRQFTWFLAGLMSVYMLCSIYGVKYISNGYGSVWYSELFTMASFWTQVRGTMRAIFWRKFQKFIVTSKRGRQSKSIWPFVRPQLILIVISILALVWAWSRVVMGISDDVFKPVLASFWALFHMLLAYLVVRRALWPDDRRYTTRHIVHLPIAYEIATDASAVVARSPDRATTVCRGFGVTGDLNDMGVGFVAYERLPEGTPLRLSLYGGGASIECMGSIKNSRPLTPKGGAAVDGPAGYHYGIEFDEPSADKKDALNHLCLHYAVPRLYAFYEQEHQRMDDAVKAQLAHLFLHRRAARRRGFHLPVFVGLNQDGSILPAVTEDISSKAMAVMVEEEAAPGTECPFTLITPLGEVKGTGRVLRSVPRIYSARRFYLCVLEFTEFEGGGRIILDALLDKGAGKRLHSVLTPTRLPMPVPVNRPLATGMAAAAIFIFAELGMFRWVYNDDFFLQSVASSNQQIGPQDSANIDRIYAATMREPYPSTDRLVLLGHTLQRMDRATELAEVTKVLGPRDRNNLDLQLALAFAYDQREDYDQADVEYRRLLAAVDQGKISEGRREELMAGAARCSVHAGRQDLASERYRQLLERFPDRPAYRNEFAGVLLDSGRLDEAADLYQGHNPDYEGRVLLVMIQTAAKNPAAAEREARALLKDNPGDATAEGMLADVLNLRGDFRQARSIYERLLKSNAADLKLAVQLAHTSLWAKNYQEALERLQAVADRGVFEDPDALRKFPDLPRSYVNAAANAPDVKAVGRQTILQLADHALADKSNDAAFLAQLGYVLHRLEEYDQSSAVLQRALELDPNDASTRRQLAGVLVALGKPDDALKLLQGRETSLDAHVMMVDVYAAAKDYTSAERECRELLKGRPDDQELRFRLANILSWNKQYPQALEAFAELVKADPKNPEYTVRQAETTLWSGDCKGALEMYQTQLTADFDRPDLWWGFVDAAAGAAAMTDGQIRVALAVADKTVKGEHKSSRVVEIFRKQGKELTEISYLTRLGWVLQHHAKDADRAGDVLNLALALQPREPAARKELAGVLAAASRYADALRMYDGLQLEWQDRLPLARIYAAAEDFDGAMEQCRLVLDKQPLDKDAQRLLADVLSWKGDYAASLEQFARLVKAFPEDKDLRRRQAEVTLWSGNARQALDLFQAALKDGADQPLLSAGFMEAAGRLEQLTPEQSTRAKEIAAKPIAAKSGNIELMARTAWVRYHHLNDKPGARTLILQAVDLPCDDPAVLTRLGWILHEMGDKNESQKALDKAVALKPRILSVRKELAGVLTAVQRFPEAHSLLEALAKDYPKDAALQGDLARVSLWAGNPVEALSRLQTMLEANFQQPELWRSYADAASMVPDLNAKQTDLALRIADIVARSGDHATTVNMSKEEESLFLSRLGWALYREGERTISPALRDRSGALLDRAVALQPQEAKVREELVGVLVAAGRSKQAVPWLEELAQAHPDDAALQARLAQAALWGGDAVGALNRLERLLTANEAQPQLWGAYADAAAAAAKGVMTTQQIDRIAKLGDSAPPDGVPDKTLYQSRLAWVLYREGRKDKADVLLGKVLAAAPVVARSGDRATTGGGQVVAGSPDQSAIKARREIAGVLTAAGRFKEALAWLEELAKSDPTDAALQGQLAQTLLWSGDPAAALPRLSLALTANFDQPALWVSTIDAAAGATQGTLTRPQVQLVLRIAERPAPESAPDKALYLSRLAWVLYREEEQTRAADLLDQATALDPKDPKTRRELAGVLTAVGKNDAALRLYEGLTLDLEDRFQMVVLFCAARRFPEAEKHCRSILAEKPDEPRARRWLADVLLWSNQYAAALAQYQRLLAADFEQPALWPSYVEAASRAETLTEEQTRLALEIIDQDEDDAQDSVYLARTALLLHRHVEQKNTLPLLAGRTVGLLASPLAPVALLTSTAAAAESARPTQSRILFTRAVAARPRQNPTALARLAFMAHQMGQTPDAITLLDEAIALHPAEPAVRRELGDSLVAMGRLGAALAWFEELAAGNPKDIELQTRLAQVTVWSGAYAKGLDRLEKLLQAEFEQTALWTTYVDAASGAPSMTETQRELALRIAARPLPVKEAAAQTLYLARLAWALLRESERAKGDGWLSDANKLLDQAMKLAAPDLQAQRELAGVLGAARRFTEALKLYEELAAAYPNDEALRIRVAEMSLWSGAYAKAVSHYEDLLQSNFEQPALWRGYVDAASGAPSLTAAQTQLVLRVAGQEPIFKDADEEAAYLSRLAWTLVREADKDNPVDAKLAKAEVLLTRAVALKPQDPKVRRELAGVLAAAGKGEAGLAMYDGLTLNAGDRLQMIGLYASAKRFAEAQAQCRALLKEKPNDREARVMLARTTLWGGDSAAALDQMQALLAEDFAQPDLWTSFVDAAAAAQEMKPAHLALALRIAEQPITAQRTPVLFLSRLAWTLIREGKAAKDQRMLQQAARLLDRALALKPREAERRELAGVLASAGNNKAALQLLAGLEAAGVADLAVRVSLYAADKNFEAAEKAAHQWLELAPDDFEARFQLANVLSWNKQYDEAAQRFQKLAEAKPDDPRLPPRLAEIALWSGQYEIALERYYLLLQPNWRQPELWQGYIDAAAAAKALPADPHKAMLLHIYEKLVQAPSEDAAFLGRFAWTLRRVDEPMKSVALLKRAVELDPKSREMRRQFADALSAAELFDDAEKQYKILLRSAP